MHVLAAGGVYDGRGLAAALAWGAVGAWVGTRFICAAESGAPEVHRRAVLPVAEIFRSTLSYHSTSYGPGCAHVLLSCSAAVS